MSYYIELFYFELITYPRLNFDGGLADTHSEPACLNPSSAELFWGNMIINLYLRLFLDTGLVQAAGLLFMS